ncbi:MAG TPA: hypothetical protein VF510_20030 [Ktedonobacterales bacterium]
MSTEIIEKSAFYQEALAKGRAQGIEQGKGEGIEQGKTVSVVEGLREAVLAMLHERFGMLPSALEQRVAGADAATLREVLAHAVIETLDQVSERLR